MHAAAHARARIGHGIRMRKAVRRSPAIAIARERDSISRSIAIANSNPLHAQHVQLRRPRPSSSRST
jgi:hypothetical protein